MELEYICHSSIFIKTGDTNILFDPWFEGPAYHQQWHVFPKPVNTLQLQSAQNIIITHGHEDHLHTATLKTLPKGARVFFPYQWRAGAKEYFGHMGFKDVTEAISFKTYQLGVNTKITYIGFALESTVVIEAEGKVLVNINDSLNSHHQNVVDVFVMEIKKRWPVIDYLISGWSGAGYFPNTVHYQNKDDIDVAKIREQYFANHLCKIIHALQPKSVIPFAPGFVLLRNDKQWINEVKFPRTYLKEYYNKYFELNNDKKFIIMQPGDIISNDIHEKISPYHQLEIKKSINHLIAVQYEKEIIASNAFSTVPKQSLSEIVHKVLNLVNKNTKLYSNEVLLDTCFSLNFADSEETVFYNFVFHVGEFNFTTTAIQSPQSKLLITTWSYLLQSCIDKEWGGDILTIGYGLDVYVYDEMTLEKNLDIVCVRLISRFPSAQRDLRKNPLRALKFYFNQPMLARLALKQKVQLRSAVNKYPYNERDHWITYTKCELCKVCNMPLLSYEFGERLWN
nr:MBL fold metallo-hydrolase [Bacteroidota bacterium]